MTQQTLFDLPTSPEAFGVVLTPANLRKIDFSALDFESARKAIYEYIQTYFPDQFNDFVASNGIIMVTEIVASVVAKLALRADLIANESTLPTARTERAVINHLALINQKINNATPASADFEITVENPVYTDIIIPSGTRLQTTGPNNTTITYEVFKSPFDYTGNIVIPAGKRGVIAFGIEGITTTASPAVSVGGISQVLNIQDTSILDNPITISVEFGGIIEHYEPTFDPIERYGPGDLVAQIIMSSTGMTVKFGDDLSGKSPKVGSNIGITYRKGGGIRGRIGAFVIDSTKQIRANPPSNIAVPVRFRNITASVGGSDRESIDAAKKRAPKDYALQRSIVTAEDYAQSAITFSHSAFGKVAKAVATARSGLNASVVDLYILAEGTNSLASPSSGLMTALKNYIDYINVITDTVNVYTGYLKSVDLDMNVVLNRSAEASVVKSNVEAAITAYFDYQKWSMGESFYLSDFVETINSIDGVLYVDVFNPTGNILGENVIVSDTVKTSANRVGANELVSLRSRSVNYYYEKVN